MTKPAVEALPSSEDLGFIEKLAADVRDKTAALEEAQERLDDAVAAHKQRLSEILGTTQKEKGPRGERLEKVRQLMEKGLSAEEIGKEIGYPPNVVKRLMGRVKEKQEAKEEAKEEETERDIRPSVGRSAPIKVPAPILYQPEEDDPSIDELKVAAKKVFSIKSREACLMTSMHDGHSHVAKINLEGMGYTTPGKDGHTHRVFNFIVGPGPGPLDHRHHLLAVPASDK